MIGQRIQLARKQMKMNQEALSEKLGFKDRQILSNIESGKRKLAPDELLVIMEVLQKPMDFFTDRLQLIGEGSFCWRVTEHHPERLDEFENAAKQWIATYRALGESLQEESSPIMQYLPLTLRSSFEEAAEQGERLVSNWNLGDRPAECVARAVEDKINALVLYVDPPEYSGVSGAACHLKEFNTILINRRDVSGRRNFDFAHELFHVLTWDAMPPERIDRDNPENSRARRREYLANNFAGGLLMPRSVVEPLWNERGAKNVNDWLNETAEALCVTAKALKTRLEILGFIKRGDTDIEEDKLTFNGWPPGVDDMPKLFSLRFMERLYRALDKGYISVRKAVNVLKLETIEDLEDLFRDHGMEPPFDL